MLDNYQIDAVDFIHKIQKCGIFGEMGSGKTLISLTAAQQMLDDFHIRRVLVIAPKIVANHQWTTELAKYDHLSHITHSVATGSPSQRLKALMDDSDIHIINRENIVWLRNQGIWRWDMVIVDESTSFKSHNSKRSLALRQMIKPAKSVVLLTGTPQPNSITDLWAQMMLVDGGERLEHFITHFRQKYMRKNPYGYNWEVKQGSNEKIARLISDITLTLYDKRKEDVVECTSSIEYVNFDHDLMKRYKSFKNNYMLQIDNKTQIEMPIMGAIVNKLLQYSNGAVYDQNRAIHNIHDLKIKKLKEIMDAHPNDNFLIGYTFKHDLYRIMSAFPEARIFSKNNRELDEWNEGKIKMLVVHPKSAGHGLNFQKGGRILIWFGLNWSLELYQQFNARLHRRGQTKRVKIIHILTKGTADEHVLDVLTHKSKNQRRLINHLRNDLITDENSEYKKFYNSNKMMTI